MLQEFIVWAESKTIEAAAKEMHISQSTLSKHLIALEADLGISLINRHDKGRLTPAGVRFYNGIVDVMERLNKTVEESRQIAEKTDYEIIVGTPSSSRVLCASWSASCMRFQKSVRFLSTSP